jgi:undecaprenyl-diphosphatase
MMLDYILDLDWQLFHLINTVWTAPWADQFFPFVTDLHKTLPFKIIVPPLVLFLFIWRRGPKKGLIIFFFCIFSLLAADGIGNHGFKKTIQRPRPGDTAGLAVIPRAPYGGYSFVSNHSANMFGMASFTAAMFPPAAVPMYGMALVVGYSRVYNGVHFPTDVFGGAFVGIFCGLLMAFICKMILRRLESVEVVGS